MIMPKLLNAMKKGICPIFKDSQGYHPNGLTKQQLYEGVCEIFDYVYRNPSVLNPVEDVRNESLELITTAREAYRLRKDYRTLLELSAMVKLAAQAGLISMREVRDFLDLDK